MFELATREKYRFPFKGMINVEDLWDLSIEDLDVVFKNLNRELKQYDEESLITSSDVRNATLLNKIAIVKHIAEFKMEEAEFRRTERERANQRQKIMSILADKQNDSLNSKSIEELKAMLEDLQ